MKSWLQLLPFGSRVWNRWPTAAYKHKHYQERLTTVQKHLTECLDIAPHGPLRIISICAGDGRDVIAVLRSHRRRRDTSAWLVERNGQSVADGQHAAESAELTDSVTFLQQDATAWSTYTYVYPADIVLLCGVWGHVPPTDRLTLVKALEALCRPGATVVWTRKVGKRSDRLKEIDAAFEDSYWRSIRKTFTTGEKWAVVTSQYCGPPFDLPRSGRLFQFHRRAGNLHVSR